ncbi:hypothetical protein CVT26_009910 [Gymnopilus dilepis]|uniref:Uncharacterized protein n=1 Tax=Gymnopilus dilepis TaxID=231916 RepID=A0A409YBY9_9AGAR|nr:hypothetical protein CVT26_009910 [Gymnopilus dilepis]
MATYLSSADSLLLLRHSLSSLAVRVLISVTFLSFILPMPPQRSKARALLGMSIMLAHHDRALWEILEEAPQEKQSLTVPKGA